MQAGRQAWDANSAAQGGQAGACRHGPALLQALHTLQAAAARARSEALPGAKSPVVPYLLSPPPLHPVGAP